MTDKPQPEAHHKLYLHGKPVHDFVEVHEHVSPTSSYLKVLGALFVLTALTYGVSYADLGPASLTVALIVAFAKATLVCMYFMHLRYDDKYHVFVFISTLLFVGIFFSITIFDLVSRNRLNEEQDTFYRRTWGGWSDQQLVKKPIPQPAPPASPSPGAEAAPDEAAAPEGKAGVGAAAPAGGGEPTQPGQ